MDTKRPRMLDLNAPLLSTRRSNTATSLEISRTNSLRGMCERVPFSWEQSPGKPKDPVRRESFRCEDLPLPKPPLIRWQEEAYTSCCYDTDTVDVGGDHEGEDDDDNNDNNNSNYDDDIFSDGIDLFSLAPSLNPSERPDRESARGDTDLDSDIGGNNGSSSPSFMIQRFLPAATALAASSLSDLKGKKQPMSRYPSNNDISSMGGSCVPRVAGQAFSTSKGCGLELLFPWRAKHKLSRIKSPIRRVHPSLKPQFGPRK